MTRPQENRLVIRDARPEELDEVSRILSLAYQEYAPAVPSGAWEPYAQSIADVRSRLEESALIVAAEEEERILGAVTFYPDASLSGEG